MRSKLHPICAKPATNSNGDVKTHECCEQIVESCKWMALSHIICTPNAHCGLFSAKVERPDFAFAKAV